MMEIAPLMPEMPGFAALLDESQADGFGMLTRLKDEWESGVNRFDRRGETLFGVLAGGALVGVGGRNIDPFAGDPAIGRVRHVYVARDRRRDGVGRLIIAGILDDARSFFTCLHLRAPETAFGFYDHMGFERTTGIATATHRYML